MMEQSLNHAAKARGSHMQAAAIERVRAGMRRARLEGRHIGRNPLVIDRDAIHRERCQGHSIRQIAKGHLVSTATIQRVLKDAQLNSNSQEQIA
jgi:DNA invertase Pin-like site-specific DNA recombinase